MIFYLLRILYLFIAAMFRKKLPTAGPDGCVMHSRVGLLDIDMFGHVNNAAYLSILEYARWDMTFRTGIRHLFTVHGWYPILVMADVRYKRQLGPFQAYYVKTKLVGLRGHNMYFSQRIYTADHKLSCAALIKFYMLKGGLRSKEFISDEEMENVLGHEISASQEHIKLFELGSEMEGMLLNDSDL